MELQVIPLANMWPDPNNPRKDFGDLDALADTFEMNVVRPFEPVNPPTVVPDGASARGQMYRIVDGERRWRAMVKRGAAESCAAIVCSMDEANAMAAMVATDDKARLTDAELSRGVQQMLAVGVAPEEVDKAARLKRGTARRVAKVAREGTEQMGIDQLLAAEEFGDDADARDKVLAAKGDRWEAVAASTRAERRKAAAVEELSAACESAGLPLVESEKEARAAGLVYRGGATAQNVAAKRAGLPGGAVAVITWSQWSDATAYLYGPPEDPEPEPYEADAAECSRMCEAARKSRDAWLVERAQLEECFALCEPILVAALDAGEVVDPYDYATSSWLKKSLPEGARLADVGSIVRAYLSMNSDSPVGIDETTGEAQLGYMGEKRAIRWLRLGEAMAECGYEAPGDERELSEIVAKALEAAEKEKEEEEEEEDE